MRHVKINQIALWFIYKILYSTSELIKIIVSTRRFSYPFGHFVDFNVQKVQVLIKVLVFEQSFPDHLEKKIHKVASRLEHNIEQQHFSCYAKKKLKSSDAMLPCWAFCPSGPLPASACDCWKTQEAGFCLSTARTKCSRQTTCQYRSHKASLWLRK